MSLRTISIMAALLASLTLTRGNIIGNDIADDGDGVITCSGICNFLNPAPGEFSMTIAGTHNLWGTGDIKGNIFTDTETDPSLSFYNEIDNDTGTAWGDYHIQITLNKTFTISDVGVDNSGWTVSSVIAPTQVGSSWIGYINYEGYGNPVDIAGTLDFNYTISFIGGVSFCESLTPSVVPEPGTWTLLVCGLVVPFFMRRRSA